MRLSFILFILCSLYPLAEEPLYAQNNRQEEGAETGSDELQVVRKIRFTGNENIPNRTLQTLVRTRTNREFLGIPRFTPWYYIWRIFGVGESPSLLDRDVIANDIERIGVFYENMGFFETGVDTTVIEFRPGRYEVSFIIEEGPASTIRSVSYTGIPDFEETRTREQFFSRNVFSRRAVNDSTFEVNRQYRAQNLRDEQTRIINFLKDHGYASVQRDSVNALVKRDTENPAFVDILYVVNPGRIYTFGDVHIRLSGPDGQEGFDESLQVEGPPYTEQGYTINMAKQSSAQTHFDLLTDQIQFIPGSTFNQSSYLRSVNAFQNLGMLVVNRFGLSDESALPDYSNPVIPAYFTLQTLPRHSIRSEFFGMRRYGFGSGIGVNYNNNNLFGKAENLTIGLNTNFEFVPSHTFDEIAPRDTLGRRETSARIFQSYNIQGEYSVPRLHFPLGFLRRSSWMETARTRYSLRFGQSNQLFFDINSDIRFNTRYEFIHSPRLTTFLDLVDMEIVDANPSSQFRQNLENEFADDPFTLQRILEDFDPHFSSILRVTLRDQNTHLIKRNSGSFSEYSVAFGGNIPYLMDRFIFSPGEIRGTLPSPFGISRSTLRYSRFIKLSADYRRYMPISPNAVFAFRLFGGYAHPVGQSESIPLSRRFFAGGSNDIRGWSPFRLGPGSIPPDEVRIPGGEIKLALFKEFRQTFLRNVLNAQWDVTWYTDAGNVWYGPKSTLRSDVDEDNVELLQDGQFFFDTFYKQIAVGSGIGLRLDWEFIVARFDFTFRAHDLEQGWFNNRLLYFSFGIGHSF